MDKRAVVESIMRNLDFDLETVPTVHKPNTAQARTTTATKTDPLNIKIRVRKKDNERCSQGFMTPHLSEPEMVLRKVRLVNSEKTIMSFDMFMEADLDESATAKPRNMFGSCLGATEEDDGPYSKSDGKIRTQYPLTKKTYDPFTDSAPTRRERTFLGQKCKPGGCLDPPFGEDRYAYMPHVLEPSRPQNVRKPQKVKPDKADIGDKRAIQQQIISPIKKNPMDDSTNPSATRIPDPIINIYKTESPKSSLIMYPSDSEKKSQEPNIASEMKQSKDYKTRPSIENKFRYPVIDPSIIPKLNVTPKGDKDSRSKPRGEDKYKYPPVIDNDVRKPSVTSEGDESSVYKNIRTSEDKSKKTIDDENKPPRTRLSSEYNENRFYNNRRSTDEKYRQSVNESINSFFSPPKGIRRESSQRDSSKRHSNIPITENKPVEHFIPPIAASVSSESVHSEQSADPKYIEDARFKDDKVPEELIKSKPDPEINAQEQNIPIFVPLPLPVEVKQDDKNIISEDIDLSQPSLDKHTTESPISPELSTSSSVNIISENNKIVELIEDIYDETPKTPQSEPKPITKEMNTASFEKSPSQTSHTPKTMDYENIKETNVYDDKNKEIEPKDIIKERFGQERFEKIKEDDNQVIENDSLNSVTISLDDTTENIDSIPEPVSQIDTTIQTEYTQDIEVLHKPKIDLQPQEEAVEYYEVPKFIHPPTTYLITSPKNANIYQETKPKEPVKPVESLTKDAAPIKSADRDNSPPNEDITSELNISGADVDNTLETISNIPNIPKTHSLTSSPNEISIKEEIKVTPNSEWFQNTELKHPESSKPRRKPTEIEDDTDNKVKTLTPTNVSIKDRDTMFLDLGFHSYFDSENKRILKTIDNTTATKRYTNDSTVIIKSPVKYPYEKDHKFVVPIDSKHDILIELKKRHEKIKLQDNKPQDNKVENKPISEIIQGNGHNVKISNEVQDINEYRIHTNTNENEKVHSKLADIYEQELVPLQIMIRDLKQEIDTLAAQQTAYRKKVICLKATLPQLIHQSNKR